MAKEGEEDAGAAGMDEEMVEVSSMEFAMATVIAEAEALDPAMLEEEDGLAEVGLTQVYSVDYYKMLAPVAKLASIPTILTIAARNNWPINMFNFHSSFLNGQLNEDKEVFMEQPPGYEESDLQKYCVKLYKSLYGLKQAGCKLYEIVCRFNSCNSCR